MSDVAAMQSTSGPQSSSHPRYRGPSQPRVDSNTEATLRFILVALRDGNMTHVVVKANHTQLVDDHTAIICTPHLGTAAIHTPA